jgi:hypothetical protein
MKFIGEKSPDLFFSQAEMKGFGDELFDGGINLAATGLYFESGRLMGDVGALAAPGFDEAVPFEDLVDLGDGEGVDAELGREVADRRQLGTLRKLSREDAVLELLLQLHVEGDAAVGVKEKHGVVEQ